jgi:hypothetical protein
MVNIHIAYTEPVNPSGATPILTRDQIWRGLQRKVRRAQDFIAVVEGCDIVSDEPDEVVRIAHFKAFAGKPPGSMKEVCRSYWPTKVRFFFICITIIMLVVDSRWADMGLFFYIIGGFPSTGWCGHYEYDF